MSNLKKVSSSSDFSGIIQRLRFTCVLKDFDDAEPYIQSHKGK